MYLVVVDSFNCSSTRATDAEKLSTAKTWSRILIDIIPEWRLQDAFDLAFKNHASSFPVNAYDLKLAWAELEALDVEQAARIQTEEKTLNRVNYCPEKFNHRSDSEATVEYMVAGEYRRLPCVHCRNEAYWQRVKDITAQSRDEKTNEQILNEMPEKREFDGKLKIIK